MVSGWKDAWHEGTGVIWKMLRKIFLVFAALCSSWNIGRAETTASQPIVVVISLDGFPARALKDPRLPMPTLRQLATDGVAADGMIPVNPTVTWPNHTSLVTGVDASHHHVLFNGLLTFPPSGVEPVIKPWVSKDELVHAKTLYELASDRGLTTAQVDWVAIYGARGLNWSFPERPDPDGAGQEPARDLQDRILGAAETG